MSFRLLSAAYLAVLLLLSGCATVDYDYPKELSTYIPPPEGNYLRDRYESLTKGAPGESGFYLLSDGIDSLAARLLMAEQAESTIDAQYYLITDDNIGMVFLGALLDAADRGVRVRLLIDDIQTQGYDDGLGALHRHPNFEVRIFNPFYTRNARILDFWRFSRLNRRMHNKSFTADNIVTIVGGRNIADEYFGAREDVNFGDLDVLGVGPVVTETSEMFDQYWNHQVAVPVPGFTNVPEDTSETMARLRARIQKARSAFEGTQYLEAFSETWESLRADKDTSSLIWAPYQLVYDSPDKSDKKKAETAPSIITPLRDSLGSAKKEIVIVSPYFVPRKAGEVSFKEVIDKGIKISVVTNSLAANNHATVHSGYVPSRKPLLEIGVDLYEVKANARLSGVDRGGNGAALATLHTKAYLVDDDTFFLGSFNFDPRSAYINTELGVIIKSKEIGTQVLESMKHKQHDHAYKVELDDKGNVVWKDYAVEPPVTYTKEPDTSAWVRFKVGFMRLMPIKSQL